MTPQKALERAKIGLMLHGSAFICSVAFSMRHVFSDDITTAAVDGRSITYNPEFFLSLSSEERVSLIAHETWHPILMHMARRGNRDPNIYNAAGDYVINQFLLDSKFVPIPGWLQDDQYKNMTTEQVYDKIILDSPPAPTIQDIIYSEGTEAERKELEVHMETVLVRAKTQSELAKDPAGAIPGDVAKLIDKLINPVLPWETLVEQYLTEQCKDNYSWKRPNKRFMPDYYLPSMHSESLMDITIAIDTSGSNFGTENLQKILSEIEYIRDVFKPKTITLIDCDYKIHNVFDVTQSTTLLDLKFTGGGGTCCYPVFEYCEEHKTNLLIYFTDLYVRKPFKGDVDYPVLWVVYDNPRASVHVGEIIHYNIGA